MRVVLEDCAKNKRKLSLTLRYELKLPPAATFTVDFSQSGTSAALGVSFDPDIASTGSGAKSGQARELRQEISLSCLRPFSCPPEIVMAAGGRHSLQNARVLLPVTVSTFMTGLSLSADDFRNEWSALSYPEQMEQAVLGDAEPKANGTELGKDCPQKQRVSPADVRQLLFETLGMREAPCGESSAKGVELIAAAGVLQISEVASGVSVVCLVGVELHGATGAARVTTKSTDHVLAEGIQKEVLEGIHFANGCARAAESVPGKPGRAAY